VKRDSGKLLRLVEIVEEEIYGKSRRLVKIN
jgi:hypothetical protein